MPGPDEVLVADSYAMCAIPTKGKIEKRHFVKMVAPCFTSFGTS